MEGSFKFHDTDLERDVSERLEKILSQAESLSRMPHITLEEINKYTRGAIEDAKKQGNAALYRSLVLHITENAFKKVVESR